MQDHFHSLLTKWCSFTDEQYLLFKSKFRQETYNKNEYWLKAGQSCSSIAFVESGLLRYYYLNNEGDEVTCYFASGNEFITSYQSYTQQTVAYENIEALTDAKLWIIDRADFNTLLTLLPQVKSIWEIAVQRLVLLCCKVYPQRNVISISCNIILNCCCKFPYNTLPLTLVLLLSTSAV